MTPQHAPNLRVGRCPFGANGKAMAIGDAHGLTQTVFDVTSDALVHTVFAHPTLSEAMHESVLHAWGRPLHI